MKYAIFGDMHGKDISALESALDNINPDTIICLGDFDQTKIIHQFMDMEKRYLDKGKEVIKVPGNHDHALLTGLEIHSGTIYSQGTSDIELEYELFADPVAREYTKSLLNPKDLKIINNMARTVLDSKTFGKDYKTIIMHGAYDGDLSAYEGCPAEIRNLWARLLSKEDHKRNFKAMESNGYNVMIRGHDHKPYYAYKTLKKA